MSLLILTTESLHFQVLNGLLVEMVEWLSNSLLSLQIALRVMNIASHSSLDENSHLSDQLVSLHLRQRRDFQARSVLVVFYRVLYSWKDVSYGECSAW